MDGIPNLVRLYMHTILLFRSPQSIHPLRQCLEKWHAYLWTVIPIFLNAKQKLEKDKHARSPELKERAMK